MKKDRYCLYSCLFLLYIVQLEEAGEEKVRLEEKQRAARKAREKRKEEWKPV